jgi:hypothetical protein
MFRILLGLLVIIAAGCGDSWELSSAERAKLAPPLLALLTGDQVADELYDVTSLPDGTKEYGVIVRCSQPDELRSADIRVRSVLGDVVTATVTRAQLRLVVSLPSVRWVEQGSKLEIQR